MKPSGWVYLSFVDEVDGVEQFMGACVVRGHDALSGAREAHRLKINPGGQVLGMPVPMECLQRLPVNRLLSRADLEAESEIVQVGDLTEEEMAVLNANSESLTP